MINIERDQIDISAFSKEFKSPACRPGKDAFGKNQPPGVGKHLHRGAVDKDMQAEQVIGGNEVCSMARRKTLFEITPAGMRTVEV